MSVLEVKNLTKIYKSRENNQNIIVLDKVNQTFEKGKIYNIIGHSGAGKTTLLRIIGLLVEYNNGTIIINNNDSSKMSDKIKASIRNQNIGFVFQNYLLNDNLKAIENIMVPMYINKNIKIKDRKKKAKELLKKVNLDTKENNYPKEMSGGEQQRVAIARALANNPEIILADEPTGNLDKDNEKIILDIFSKLKDEGKCIIVASHSDYVKDYSDVILKIDNGKLEVLK